MKQIFKLVHPEARRRALRSVSEAQDGAIVEIRPNTRTLEQNARLWAALSEVAQQVEWHGEYLTPTDWKTMFTASLRKQKAVPGLDGGFVVLGERTSRMTKAEFSDLLEVINAFAAERGVEFKEPEWRWML